MKSACVASLKIGLDDQLLQPYDQKDLQKSVVATSGDEASQVARSFQRATNTLVTNRIIMEKSINKAISNMEEKGWITINENLNPEAVTKEIIRHMKEMKLIDFVKSFSPSELRN